MVTGRYDLSATSEIGLKAGLTEEQKNAQLEAAGLLDPMEQQLGRFYGQLLRLDFGTSRRIQNGAPVLKVIGTKFSVSMRLGCIAW